MHYWLLLWLLCPLSFAQTIYTWTDSQGVVHFSDTPPPSNAQDQDSFFMPDQHQTTLSPSVEPAIPASQDPQPGPAEKKAQPPALTLRIASPQHDQTIRNNRGQFDIHAKINRKLMVGEQLQLQIDGEDFGAPQTLKKWQLKNIDRGTHSLVIKALINGKLIASSDPITVHLHRAKVK